MLAIAMLRSIKPRPRAVVCALLLVACALAPARNARAQVAPAREAKDNGAISGRITNDNHGVAGVLVTLAAAQDSEQRKSPLKTTTDADGRYRLLNVPPGRYYLNPFAPAFVVSDVNPAEWQPGRLLNVAPGDKLDGIDFTLTRGGVITGRVTNGDGKPLVETMVRIMAADEADRKKPQFQIPLFQFQTDDRGVYRLFGLAQGRYLVFVGDAPEDGTVRVGGSGNYTPQTFYGNTSEVAQARPVEVETGAEATAIDIVVGKQPRGYEAAGRVVDERGHAVAGVSCVYGPVNAEGRFMGSFGSDGSQTNERGEFHLRGLSPGRYGIFASQGRPFSQEPSQTYSSTAVFDVLDADVNGLELKIARGATLNGIVQFEGTPSPAVVAKLAELRLGANLRSSSPAIMLSFNTSQAKVNADGSFQLTGLRPGKTSLLLGWPQVKGITIAHVQRDGVEQPEGIEVGAGENITGVRVVLTYGASTIRGQVQFTSARPTGGQLHAEVHRIGAPVGTGGGYGDVDTLGRFVIENLAAGEYEVLLFEDYPAFGSEQRRPPVDRKVVTVPENGEAQLTLVFKQGDTPQ
ncbi:MAG: collagen binding domain-containing protein [Pyrinomonadaceae bacterium]